MRAEVRVAATIAAPISMNSKSMLLGKAMLQSHAIGTTVSKTTAGQTNAAIPNNPNSLLADICQPSHFSPVRSCTLSQRQTKGK